MARSRKKKNRGSIYCLWVGLVFCLACFGAYQLVLMAKGTVVILQQHGVSNKSLWQMIQTRFWEKDVPSKSTKKKKLPKNKKPSGFPPKDKAKLEHILQDNLQNNSK